MDLIKEIWKELKSLGFEGNIETFTQLYSWLRKIPLIHTVPTLKINKDKSWSSNLCSFSERVLVKAGSFGVPYLAYRETPDGNGDYVFIKTCPDFPKSLLLEAILQCTARSVLGYYGFPKAVSRVIDILQHPKDGFIFSVERSPGVSIFSDYLKSKIKWGNPCVENDKLVLSVISQVASYVYILESAIGFNHRDIKGTNVLMIADCAPYVKHVDINGHKWSLHASTRAILIDFGFACIGHPSGSSIVSAGEHLPEIDFCPKLGRDMFILLINLWNVEDFRESVTDATRDLFRRWLQGPVTNWADWLMSAVEEASKNLEGMYLLSNADHFTSKPCAPLNILRDIADTYPDLCVFTK
jgi:serine/threonine protein kinase